MLQFLEMTLLLRPVPVEQVRKVMFGSINGVAGIFFLVTIANAVTGLNTLVGTRSDT